jgi:hypothetical protein
MNARNLHWRYFEYDMQQGVSTQDLNQDFTQLCDWFLPMMMNGRVRMTERILIS